MLLHCADSSEYSRMRSRVIQLSIFRSNFTPGPVGLVFCGVPAQMRRALEPNRILEKRRETQ